MRRNKQENETKIKNILLVSSGKGGVGKTTIAVGLTLSLKRKGFKVGFLDADIYGPNAVSMFGEDEHGTPPLSKEGDTILVPSKMHEIPLISMSFFLKEGQPAIWRGPMLNSMVQQFLFQTQWGELDYLVIDTPPGTGDVQLSLAQLTPISGVLMVTTAQKAALMDTKRSISQFEKLNVPILGMVENMAYFIPEDDPTKRYDLFGSHEGKTVTKDLSYPILGSFPFETEMQSSLAKDDLAQKTPIPLENLFDHLAENVLKSLQNKKNNPSIEGHHG